MSTLYIVEPGSALRVRHQQFCIFREESTPPSKGGACALRQRELLFKVPVLEIENIVLLGYCHLSHGAIQTALYRQISVTYYSDKGYYLGCFNSESQPKVRYLQAQVKQAENDSFICQQAEIIVRAKLHNSRILLMRMNRRRPNEITEKAIAKIKAIIKCLDTHPPLESIRGYEGQGATIYFQGLSSLFTGEFIFKQRISRPPTDPINSLLGYGYTLLAQHLISTIRLAGLHTDFGNLHATRDNHPALILDLMEEFRAQVVDSLVVYLVNKKIFAADDFTLPGNNGAVYLKQDSLKTFLKHWSIKLATEITHPSTQRKVSLRVCLELQVKEYISCLMGKTLRYQPMLWQK